MSYVIRICYVIVHVHDHKNVYGSRMYAWVYIYMLHQCVYIGTHSVVICLAYIAVLYVAYFPN